LQLGLVAILVVLLVVAVASAAPDMQMRNFTPWAPHGAIGVVRAAGVLLFAFVGWEAVSHLSAEFADRERGLRRATILTLIVVGVLYLSLAVVSIGVLGKGGTSGQVPLADLLETGIGRAGRQVTGAIAVVLTFSAINTYVAGAARLGAALGGSGALPGRFARLGPSGIPRRSLALLASLVGALTVPVLVWHLDLDALMRATSACLAAVTVLGTASALRILPHGRARKTACIATGFAAVALLCCGAYLLIPAVLAVIALAVVRSSTPPGLRMTAHANLV
jgi:amino acid efflux transporter